MTEYKAELPANENRTGRILYVRHLNPLWHWSVVYAGGGQCDSGAARTERGAKRQALIAARYTGLGLSQLQAESKLPSPKLKWSQTK